MKITVTKGDIIVAYEEPQNAKDCPRLTNMADEHQRILEAIKCICEQVKTLST